MTGTGIETLLPTAVLLAGLADHLSSLVARSGWRKAENPDPGRIRTGLEGHLRFVAEWADEVRVDPKETPRTLADLFVNLDLNVALQSGFRHGRVQVSTLARHTDSLAILGQPGGGKTTSLKFMASELLKDRREDKRAPIPLLVRFRDLPEGRGLLEEISGIFGGVPKGVSRKRLDEVQTEFVLEALRRLPVTLIFDGLDEAREESVVRVRKDLAMLLRDGEARVVLTCRTAEYRVTLPRVRVCEIQGLSKPQVKELAGKWLRDGGETSRFLEQIRSNPYAGSETRPLTLVVLALLFVRKGEIPRHPQAVYERILKLFLEDWDEQRQIVRHSRYAEFTVDRKESFLEALSFQLTKMKVRGVFNHSELVAAYNAVHRRFDLPPNQASAVAREIESHTGLVLERGVDEFEFFHLTIQEYLTARYLARRGDLATTGLVLQSHPNELAVATAWASEPETFMLAMVRGLLHVGEGTQTELWRRPFVSSYFARLALEVPRIQRSSLLGLAMLHLGHLYCESEADFGHEADAEIRAFMEHTEVAASVRSMKGRYLSRAPVSEEVLPGYALFRVNAHKLRSTNDEVLRIALADCPLPEEIKLPWALLEVRRG